MDWHSLNWKTNVVLIYSKPALQSDFWSRDNCSQYQRNYPNPYFIIRSISKTFNVDESSKKLSKQKKTPSGITCKHLHWNQNLPNETFLQGKLVVRKEEPALSDFREAVSLQGVKVKMSCIKDPVRAGGGRAGMGADELQTRRCFPLLSSQAREDGCKDSAEMLVSEQVPHACSIAGRGFFPFLLILLWCLTSHLSQAHWVSSAKSLQLSL